MGRGTKGEGLLVTSNPRPYTFWHANDDEPMAWSEHRMAAAVCMSTRLAPRLSGWVGCFARYARASSNHYRSVCLPSLHLPNPGRGRCSVLDSRCSLLSQARDEAVQLRSVCRRVDRGRFVCSSDAPLDRIVVSPQEIATTTGFWFSPTREGFVYQDVRDVRITTCRDLKGRVGPAWDVHYRDGRIHQIRLSDLWSRHSVRIMSLLQSYGVVFTR